MEGCPKISWSSKPYIQGAKQFNLNDVQENLICVDENVKKSINTLEKLKASVDDGHCADWYISSSPGWFLDVYLAFMARSCIIFQISKRSF